MLVVFRVASDSEGRYGEKSRILIRLSDRGGNLADLRLIIHEIIGFERRCNGMVIF